MNQRPEALLRRYDAWERNTDKLDFQWRARLLQSLWRDEQGLVAGEYAGKTRGARLLMPEAPIRGLQVHWYVGTIVVLILVVFQFLVFFRLIKHHRELRATAV